MKGGVFCLFFSSQSCRERGTAATSSSMMFCAGMEKERGQGEEKRKIMFVFFFALCMYLYVVRSVQIYLASTRNFCSRKGKWENHKRWVTLVSSLLGIGKHFLFIYNCWCFVEFFCIKCIKQKPQKQIAWNVTNAFKGFLKGCRAIKIFIWWVQDDFKPNRKHRMFVKVRDSVLKMQLGWGETFVWTCTNTKERKKKKKLSGIHAILSI